MIADKELVARTFTLVLADFAMMFADVTDASDLAYDAHEWYRVGMSFSGEMSGQLELCAPSALNQQILDNLMGELTSPVAIETLDGLRELANEVCGQLLTAVAGTTPVWQLSVPELTTMAVDELPAFATDAIAFMIEGTPALLQFCAEPSG